MKKESDWKKAWFQKDDLTIRHFREWQWNRKRLIAVVTVINSHDRQAAPPRGDCQAMDYLCRYGAPHLLQGSVQLCQVGKGDAAGPWPSYLAYTMGTLLVVMQGRPGFSASVLWYWLKSRLTVLRWTFSLPATVLIVISDAFILFSWFLASLEQHGLIKLRKRVWKKKTNKAYGIR